MTSVLVPILYVIVLVGSLYIFSQFYRNRAAARLQKDPWWPTHPERDIYISLLQHTDPPCPEHILKAALLRRAVTDITRLQSVREDKQAATTLVQKGSVGDDLLTRLSTAEKEVEAEILEVIGEANSFKEGWGSYIFQTASEILANEKTKELYDSLSKVRSETAIQYGIKKRVKASNTLASPESSPGQDDAARSSPKSVNLSPPMASTNVSANSGSEADETPSRSSSRTTGPRTKKGKRRK